MAQNKGRDDTSADQSSEFKPSILKLDFDEDRTFEIDLRRRVDDYFRQGKGQPKTGSWRMFLKTAVILTCFTASYVLLVFFADTVWQALPLAVLLGLFTAAIGFNIAHDGGHRAYSKTAWVNKAAAVTMDLVGSSSYLWFWKHTVIHHRYVNITGYDNDINLGMLGRLSPHNKRLPFHRWQHLYLWPLYGLLAVKWEFINDFRQIRSGRLGGHRFPRPVGGELVIFVVGKVVFFAWAIFIPLMLHSFPTVLLYYLVAVVMLGTTMAVVFQLPHCVAQAEFPIPRGDMGRMEAPWAVHQARATLDFGRSNRVLRWSLGGLNFHLEHHLFPTICHIHYPAITWIVEQACRDHGIKYAEHKSFLTGLLAHFRWLRRMGAAD
jgi:linoleoyl-CoA desaturase